MTRKAHNYELHTANLPYRRNGARFAHSRTLGGGGGNALYLAQTFQSHESISQKSIILGRFSPYAVAKALKMLGQSTFILKSRILDCFDFLQKSRNDEVGGFVIAICFAFCAVIARFDNVESWQSIPYRHSERSEESILAIRESHSIRLHCTNLSAIHLIHSWFIYFAHCLKSRALDTSLRINATLSMTKFLPYHDKTKKVVILRALARSIHFSDLRILRDSLTLGESMRLNFTQFAHFGLIRHRFTRFAHDSPTNPKANQKRFMAIQSNPTHESIKHIVRDDSKLDFKLKKGVRKWHYPL